MSPERDNYAAIADYAVIGDGRTLALVARDGSIDWLCLPDFDSPSVFAALLDRRKGGRFWIGTADPAARIERRYLPQTAVLETTFHTEGGIFRVTDLMPVRSGMRARTLQPLRQIIRIVEAVEGTPELSVVFAPRPNYARNTAKLRGRGKLGWNCETDRGTLWLTCNLPMELSDDHTWLSCRASLQAGHKLHFSLVFSDRLPAILHPAGATLERHADETCGWWREWSARCQHQGPYDDAVRRSAITLKLLTHAPTGAVVAAGTTSLPEIIGGSANWDYRYCWLRDATLTLRAFLDLGYFDEGTHFMNWLLVATRLTAPRLSPVYSLYGRNCGKEFELHHLEGYRGSRPVRLGNAAADQKQLDAYGMVVEAAYDFVIRGGELDSVTKGYLAGFGGVVCDHWREPDNGIWEVRGEQRQYTHSKVLCFAALDCLIALHDRGELKIDRPRFLSERDAIRAAIEERGFSSVLGAYSGILDEDVLDASLLIMPRLGYIAADAERMTATYERLRAQIGRGALMRRHGDDFNPAVRQEGAFGICSFWEIDYLVRKGDLAEAVRLFEELLGYANDLGLYAEEIDERDHSALGNFPQAFTHIGLINAAMLIESAKARGSTA